MGEDGRTVNEHFMAVCVFVHEREREREERERERERGWVGRELIKFVKAKI